MNSGGSTPELFYEESHREDMNFLHAYTPGDPNQVGMICWHPNGIFYEAWIRPEYRRRGVASCLWFEAVRRNYDPPIRMTANRTDEGHAWASTLGTGIERIGKFNPEAIHGEY